MPKPSLTLTHLKTSKQYEAGQTINRYWFQWADRKSLDIVNVRLLFRGAGGVALADAGVKLAKTKGTEIGGYDTPRWFSVDLPADHPTIEQVQYYTVRNLVSSSDKEVVALTGKQDDLTVYERASN
ncbi:hypothetical protein A6C57_23520 [Fibrella sp. ES10-3-2-2]|nr:hypothetical protein A6C57_23520 [Fibrella sp. ES10-3-2-2]